MFHLDRFRDNQLAVMNASMSKHDCLLVMPTGGGKSLTYQVEVTRVTPPSPHSFRPSSVTE